MVRERGERPASQVPPAAAARPAPALPIDWIKLDDAERSETLQVLFDWLPRIVITYGLNENIVPRCWFRHEPMIVEILGLFQYRNQQQFNVELGPPPSAPNDFNYQLELWRGRMRSRKEEAGCTSSEHHPVSLPSWVDLAHTASAMWRVEADEHCDQLMYLAEEKAMNELESNQEESA